MQAFFNRKLYWQPISLHSILNNFTFLLNLCYFMVWENVSCWPETWIKFLTSHFQFIESFLWHFLYSTLFYLRVRLVRRCMVLCTWLSHPQLSDLIWRQKPYYENNELRDPLSKWLHQQNKQKTLQLHTCLHSIDRYDKSANLFFISRKKLLLHLRRLLISGRSSLLLIAFAPKRLRESRSSQSPPCGLHLMLREGGGKESLKKIFSLSTKLFT
jgi:hypothetical protein